MLSKKQTQTQNHDYQSMSDWWLKSNAQEAMLKAAGESTSTTETSNEYFFQENAKQIASLLSVVIA